MSLTMFYHAFPTFIMMIYEHDFELMTFFRKSDTLLLFGIKEMVKQRIFICSVSVASVFLHSTTALDWLINTSF